MTAPVARLTTRDVADELGLTVDEVRRRIRRGDLRAVNLGGKRNGARYRIARSDLDRFLAARDTTAA